MQKNKEEECDCIGIYQCLECYIEKQKKRIDRIFDEVFSEGCFNYFHTTYGSNDNNINEEMHNDLDKKLNELKKCLMGLNGGEKDGK